MPLWMRLFIDAVSALTAVFVFSLVMLIADSRPHPAVFAIAAAAGAVYGHWKTGRYLSTPCKDPR